MKSNWSGDLKSRLQGNLILPSDPVYNETRKVYNGMIDKHPAAIAQCRNTDDVIACVNIAGDNNMLLAVRGGGHNAAGLGIADDALVIDLSLMKEIKVDANAKTVKVQGGCLLKEVDTATHEVGMCVPSGIFGTTGVGGITLGGGLGNLTRSLGLAIDNLLEAEVVLANGKLAKASSTENTDLFWALRGGGGNFGVVVSFTFKMCPVHTVYAGPMLWELDDAEEMFAWHHEFINKAPDELSGYFALLTVPPFAPFPEHLHLKKMCGVVWCYAGDMEKAEAVFKPIRAKKTPSLDFVGTLTVPALNTLFDPLYPPGLIWYWKADYVKDLTAETIKKHIEYARQMPTRYCTMHMYNINGAASKVGRGETAWNYRDANYGMVIVGVADNVNDKEKVIEWAKNYWSDVHPYSMGGAYINMMMDEGADRVKASYGDNYNKLAQIKAKYDPGNLFRVNQNIKPAIA
ncbi:FAD-binding oxidoreductase [Agriterribacter sp.]|uniref:FAD-binding oxidoreductase n=1 Tax=Agriterribacter sp. TaxID=2821509 RepID=UPI002BE70CC9|nr:FAD-binding oxidoreductase [Agriterribacter sp.]HRO45496.1 FAD-binding oxidoreductase [Agriterribacter sp.]HRQ19049.1 FAD-binding oxidoreductase [Agriterribacter sp.]